MVNGLSLSLPTVLVCLRRRTLWFFDTILNGDSCNIMCVALEDLDNGWLDIAFRSCDANVVTMNNGTQFLLL